MNEAIIAAGGPADLVQCIDKPDVDVSGLLMKKVDVILATGGPDMVKGGIFLRKAGFRRRCRKFPVYRRQRNRL